MLAKHASHSKLLKDLTSITSQRKDKLFVSLSRAQDTQGIYERGSFLCFHEHKISRAKSLSLDFTGTDIASKRNPLGFCKHKSHEQKAFLVNRKHKINELEIYGHGPKAQIPFRGQKYFD
jgi:hypothetical protein